MYQEHPLPVNLNRFRNRGIPSAGFTLMEMAVVLMIAGLLMGAALKGQGMIDTVKAKRLESDFRQLPMLLSTYQDKFRALPGDDALANLHLSVSAGYPGNGNGTIDGKWFDSGTSIETAVLWRHLYLAGLLNQGTILSSADATPVNMLGGRIGMQVGAASQAPIVDASGHGLAGSYVICSAGIPGNLAQQLDISLDDGNPSTGAMLATLDNGPPYQVGMVAATVGTGRDSDLQPGQRYVVCMKT